MTIKLGVVMDSLNTVNYKKDSTLAMLWEATHRGWEIVYFQQKDLFLRDGRAMGVAHGMKVFQNPNQWYELKDVGTIALTDLNVILMRKDPPFNLEYIYTTYILEQAQRDGVLVVNDPKTLRDANEKLVALWFPEVCPPTLVTRNMDLLRDFYREHQDIICKPLDAMGGTSIFRLQPEDFNSTVVFETLTNRETQYMMAQKFIPEIKAGDNRVILINGDIIPFVLSRIPNPKDWRGNLAAGAKGVAREISEVERKIGEVVGPVMREKGVYFAGLDIIGDYLTEINITSPTCIREIDEQCQLNIASQLLDSIEASCSG